MVWLFLFSNHPARSGTIGMFICMIKCILVSSSVFVDEEVKRVDEDMAAVVEAAAAAAAASAM
jgi:hypothetical protein